MKSIKAILLLAAMMVMSFSAKADHDQVITFDQMPETAQAFHKQYFAGKVPLVVTVDWDDYTIRYESGEKVEFDKQGNWKEIDCRASIVPAELIPAEIKSNIAATFPNAAILKIDRNRRGYEVKLNNGLEVEYSPTFQVIDIDD
ncbi:MAG: PepSY-like domain-containing protein [Muribaculaceae bacterium]|nr:PepSY-like domain-containing protein [Muribaculaceae bacterium]